MRFARAYVRIGIRVGLSALLASVAGCWEKIEYTGTPSSTAASTAPKPTADALAESSTTHGPSANTSIAPPAEDNLQAPEKVTSSIPTESVPPPSSMVSTTTESDAGRDMIPTEADDSQAATPVVAQPVSLPATTPAANKPASTSDDDRYATPSSVSVPLVPTTPPAAKADAPQKTVDVPAAAPHQDAKTASATAIAAPPANAMNSRRAAWLLGSRLSLAALANDRGVAAESVPIWFADAQAAAKYLGTTVADLPEPIATNDKTPASRRVIDYLLVNGQRIGRQLTKEHGSEEASLFEIALKSNVLLLLYTPGSSAGNSVATAIQQAAPRARLRAELWRPLVDALKKQVPESDVRAAVRKMHVDVDQYLAGGAEPSGR